MDLPRRSPPFFSRQSLLPILILVCTSILAYLAMIQSWSLRPSNPTLKVGDVASQDLNAPVNIQYVSNVLTTAAQDAAERAIAPVYIPPDPAIARTQIASLSSILDAISLIRIDGNTTPAEKKVALAQVQGLSLQPDTADFFLGLTDLRWTLVRSEAFNVLGQTLHNPVRTENVDSVRQGLASTVSFTLTDREVELVVELVSPLVVANSFYSPELTDTARKAAREAVEPVTQVFVKGQNVVRSGHVLTAADLEALTELGLIKARNPLYDYLGAGALILFSAVFTSLYFSRRQPVIDNTELRGFLLLSVLFLVFLVSARIVNPNRAIIPYLFPVPAFALLVSALFGMERGMVFSLLMGVLCSYGMPEASGLMPYYVVSSLCGVLALGQARRVAHFLYAALAIAATGAAVIAAYRLPFTQTDWIGVVTLMGAAAFMGIASTGLALPLQFLLAQFLGLTTALQLLEISRPDSPLLNYFLQRAPGTYQHSLQVANLAEQAAERIQADGLLARVGALFHDIGKSSNPLFFVENQPASQIDSHEDLDPAVSAQAIISHITDGLELARRYRLPKRLQDFIAEHHGTLITRYQYNQAVQAAGGDASKVDERLFHYPGPTPRSKETALLMFADGVEACARAERPSNDDQLRALVHKVIDSRQRNGQLENAPLSQRDLAIIIESFVSTLRVTYHPRLEYPNEPSASVEASSKALVSEKTE